MRTEKSLTTTNDTTTTHNTVTAVDVTTKNQSASTPVAAASTVCPSVYHIKRLNNYFVNVHLYECTDQIVLLSPYYHIKQKYILHFI